MPHINPDWAFYLKYRDTQPVLELALKNPDNSPVDLSGASAIWLHIGLEGQAVRLSRTLAIAGPATNGTVRYQWVQSDWNAGNLVVGSHRMEAEVISGSNRQTYPNNDPSGYGQPYLALVVYEDLEQGA